MNLPTRIANRLKRIISPPPYRERIVVKTVGREEPALSDPCFLIGVYRSGTTLLRFVLDSHSNIAVPPETNFMYDLAEMYRSEWVRKGLAGAGIDEEGMRSLFRSFVAGVLDNYVKAKEKGRWVDKTPAYTGILEFLDFLYGKDCKYIMLYRHGLDVANSLAGMYEKDNLAGPAKTFADRMSESAKVIFARYWAEQCEKMLEFEKIHPIQCHRIYYEQYASDPERFIPPLFEFLGEPWEPSVLKFNEQQHDFGLQDSIIASTKKFIPRMGSYKSWSQEEISGSMNYATTTLEKLGYKVEG